MTLSINSTSSGFLISTPDLQTRYPLIGNYGVPADEPDDLGLPKNFEGGKIYLRALVISEYSFMSSHNQAQKRFKIRAREPYLSIFKNRTAARRKS